MPGKRFCVGRGVLVRGHNVPLLAVSLNLGIMRTLKLVCVYTTSSRFCGIDCCSRGSRHVEFLSEEWSEHSRFHCHAGKASRSCSPSRERARQDSMRPAQPSWLCCSCSWAPCSATISRTRLRGGRRTFMGLLPWDLGPPEEDHNLQGAFTHCGSLRVRAGFNSLQVHGLHGASP